MSLPGLSYAEWCGDPWRAAARASRADVAQYLQAYADQFVAGEQVEFRQGRVAKAVPAEVANRSAAGWTVTIQPVRSEAASAGESAGTVVHAKALVLATGTYEQPHRLGIPGEALSFVRHRPAAAAGEGSSGPLLVVGAGLSAADAILAALRSPGGGGVVHVFRGDPRQTRIWRMFGGSGAGGMYEEEALLARLMVRDENMQGYTPVEGELIRVAPDGGCTVRSSGVERLFSVARVAILIGAQPLYDWLPESVRVLHEEPLPRRAKLDGKPSSHPRFLEVDPVTGEVLRAGSEGPAAPAGAPLFSVGPARGDNFIRFVVGDAVAVASALRARLAQAADPPEAET